MQSIFSPACMMNFPSWTKKLKYKNINSFIFNSCQHVSIFLFYVLSHPNAFPAGMTPVFSRGSINLKTVLLFVPPPPLLLSLTVHHVTLLKVFFWHEGIRVDAEVRSDVVVQVPGLVFIMHHKEQSKLLLHVNPLSVGPIAAKSTGPAYHQRPQETTVQILNINKWTRSVTKIYCNTLSPI